MLTTVLLVIGYALAVPPLLRMRHFWRRRNWYVYAIELTGAVLITIGQARMESPGGVAINGLWALIFGIGFPLSAGRWPGKGVRPR